MQSLGQKIFPSIKILFIPLLGHTTWRRLAPVGFPNTNYMSLHTSQFKLQSDYLDPANRKVVSLDLSIGSQGVTIPDRFFEIVDLYGCTLTQWSVFSKVQVLILRECLSLKDITPFKDIPYLELQRLDDVKDFTSLGNHRCLIISECPGL
jgi:hypothetical protein